MGGGQFKLRRLIRQLADGKCDERRIVRFYIVGVSLLQFTGTGKGYHKVEEVGIGSY